MRLVIATCTVDYVGRLTAHLPEATRLLLLKADGSVSVHADDRAYKPLNWMSPPCTLTEVPGEWIVENRSGERLVITLSAIHHDSTHALGVDPGLTKDGVEAHLQQLLAARCEALGPGWHLVRREYPTDVGPVDLLCRDAAGAPVTLDYPGTGPAPTGAPRARHVAVEIKRNATIAAVEQLTRYLHFLNRDPLLAPVRGCLAALSITQQARTLAQDRGIECVVVDYDELRGLDDPTVRLF